MAITAHLRVLDPTQALYWLNLAIEERAFLAIMSLKSSPAYDPIRVSPLYKKLLARMNLGE